MKKNIAVMFGGKSSEYEVSLMSAESIIKNLDKNKYNIIFIGITKTGQWLTGADVFKKFQEGLKNKSSHTPAFNPPPERGPASPKLKRGERKEEGVKNKQGLSEIILDPNHNKFINAETKKQIKTDVIFPVFHGPYGEDGSMQGLFEIMGIPYVGAGILGSAVGLDKVIQKQILDNAGAPVVVYGWIQDGEFFSNGGKVVEKINFQKVLKYIGLPCFVKPANAGSSIGISVVKNSNEIKSAIELAKRYDKKVIIEQVVDNMREFECSILGNDKPEASVVGEIASANEFYDYDAKYINEKSRLIIPAKISKALSTQMQKLAVKAYKLLNCRGMARVDFLYDAKNKKLYLNEINTIPGFTQISMYPKLWEASGLSYGKLLDKLIDLATDGK